VLRVVAWLMQGFIGLSPLAMTDLKSQIRNAF
jgi:hypothetical protein